ncbi:MAG: hypothetical protein JXX28_03750 [Deltaproteobacteria bacterium]|nr:hypothetical protein [Deltaproteobacteria bacterium]
MDLIASLAAQLDIDPSQATAIAGTVLHGVKGAVADKVGPEAADTLGAAVPELSGWHAAAKAAQGGGLGGMFGGGLLGAAAGALGGQQAADTAALVALLGKLNLDPGKAVLVAPLVLSFLRERVDPALLSKVLEVAPVLAGAEAKPDLASSLGGALGGLFGR